MSTNIANMKYNNPLISYVMTVLSCSHVVIALPEDSQGHRAALSQQNAHFTLNRRGATNSLQIGNASAFSMFSSGCAAALSAPIDCSSIFASSPFDSSDVSLTAADLTSLCTTPCTESLNSYRQKVSDSCAKDIYLDPTINSTQNIPGTSDTLQIYNDQRLSIKPIAIADWYITTYNLNCLTDDSNPSQWCQVLDESSSSTSPRNPCHVCRLKALKAQMNDGRLYEPGLASMYGSLTQSCGSTALGAIVNPTPVFSSIRAGSSLTATVSATTTASSASCTGSIVPVPSGQSCSDFATAHNVSTDHLMDINGLSGNCANWPGQKSSLCVEDNCNTYVLAVNDTCPSLARDHGITITQLLSWNPFIDPWCKNLKQKVGNVICLSSPLGYTPPPSISFVNGPAPATTAAPVPQSANPRSNKNCGKWYLVQPGDYCSLLCTKNEISLADFLFLNPDIDANCTNLLAAESYCVEAVGPASKYPGYGGSSSVATLSGSLFDFATLPTTTISRLKASPTPTDFPLANGSLARCPVTLNNKDSTRSCEAVADEYGVDVLDFLAWNPSLGNRSTYDPTTCFLASSTQYCISFYDPDSVPAQNLTQPYATKPSDSPSDSTTACYDWWTVISGDTCQSILDATSNTLQDFYSWNPSVGSNCQNLWLNTSYCVFGANLLTEVFSYVKPTATITHSTSSANVATTTANTVTPPASTQSGIVSNCNQYYVAKAGDGCSAIASSYSIALSVFDGWNPAVKTDCSGLWANYAYCVNTPGATHMAKPTAKMQRRSPIKTAYETATITNK